MTARRFTDFLVNEVDLDHQVVHIKSLALPESKKEKDKTSVLAGEVADTSTGEITQDNAQAESSKIHQPDSTVAPNAGEQQQQAADEEVTWDDTFESSLSPFLSESSIVELKIMYLEGPEPPRASDNGWMSRVHTKSDDVETSEQWVLSKNGPSSSDKMRGKGGNTRGRRGRQKGRGGCSQGSGREDSRQVSSEVCHSTGPFYHFLYQSVAHWLKGCSHVPSSSGATAI